MHNDPHALEPGTVLEDRYRIEEKIGAGGMATVYKAHDKRLDTPCAVKVLNANIAMHHGPAWKGFFREARVVARMRHPNVVGVRDVHENDICYIAMDLVVGETAFTRMRRAPLGPREACRVMAAVCDGLEAGHCHRPLILHRDIKPENILLRHDGGVVIIDYGVAHFRPEENGADEQMTSATLGTFVYMSPEQKAGAPDVDCRTDVFSAGAMLWALLKGRAPTDIVLLDRDVTMQSGVPKPVLEVIVRAVQFNKHKRFATAAAMATALRAAIDALPEDPVPGTRMLVHTAEEEQSPATRTFTMRNPFAGRTVNWRALGVMVACVAAVGVGGAWYVQTDDAPVATLAESIVVPVTAPPTPSTAVTATAETPKPSPPVAVVEVVPTPAPVVDKTADATPTPKPTQVADTTPRVVHKVVKNAKAGSTIVLTANVKNTDVQEVWLFSRTTGTTRWDSVPMRPSDNGYRATLVATTPGMQYYISARPKDGEALTHGNRKDPNVISVD